MENNKISMKEFFDNKELLEVTYIPFDTKLQTVFVVLQSIIDNYGYLNRSILRRIATETILDVITNVDMSMECEHELKGFDYMYYKQDFQILDYIEIQYNEFMKILDEQIADYNDGKFKVVKSDET